MRIALVVTGGVDRSGRERVIPALLWLIERLSRRHEVVVYALRYHDRPCRYPLLGATVHDLGRPRGIVGQVAALLRALRRDRPVDVIHGYWAVPAGLAAAYAGWRLRVPTVVTADSGEFVALPHIAYGLQRHWRHRLAVRAALRLASRVTVCSAFMQQLARRHGCDPEVIPIGVDGGTFHPRAHPPAPVDMPIPWRLLHVASLNPVKDQGTLLRAFRRVVDVCGPGAVHLDVAGEDTMRGAIHEQAVQLGIQESVTFHGAVPTDVLVPMYQRADAFVLSSQHEAACVAALEAAACDVPAVGTAVGYLHDWTPDRAVTVPVGDAAALGDAVVQLLRDPARRRTLATSARAWATAHDADWSAARFADLYERVRAHPG